MLDNKTPVSIDILNNIKLTKYNFFIVYDNILLTSDRHILHKNIIKYEKNNRINFLPFLEYFKYKNLTKEDNKKKFIDDFVTNNTIHSSKILTLNLNLLKNINKELNYILNNHKNIEYFYNLGDFVPFRNNSKKNLLKDYKEIYNNIFYIFQTLQNNNIKSTLILGNHDDSKYKYQECREFYKTFFDEIKMFDLFIKNGIKHALTHYPFGQSFVDSKIEDKRKNGKKEINQNFVDIDQKLLLNLRGETEIINFHGHTHSKKVEDLEKFKIMDKPYVYYINCCIDNF